MMDTDPYLDDQFFRLMREARRLLPGHFLDEAADFIARRSDLLHPAVPDGMPTYQERN